MADVTDKPTENIEEKSTKADEVDETMETAEKSNGTKTNDDAAAAAENGTTANKSDKPIEAQIIRQVEYYFGDVNLGRDKFLMEQIKKNEDGWVTLDVLMTFKRLSALSTNADEIVDALSKSEEGLIEISEDRKSIRRHPERLLPEHNEERRKELVTRTAYAKGFPGDATMDVLLDFFETFDKVQNLTMRKYYDKNDKKYKFKGSVFVTFEKKEQCAKFIEDPEVKYKEEHELLRKWQQTYLDEKNAEREAKKKRNQKPKEEKKEIVLPKGTVLHFEGITDDTKREAIRGAVEKVDAEMKIAYIDFSQGQKEGKIRFHDEGQATKFLEKLEDKKLPVKEGMDLTLRTLGDEEEDEFLKQVIKNMQNMRTKQKGRFGKGRKGGRGGRNGGRNGGRGGGDGDDGGHNRKRRFGNFNDRDGKKQKLDEGGDDE